MIRLPIAFFAVAVSMLPATAAAQTKAVIVEGGVSVGTLTGGPSAIGWAPGFLAGVSVTPTGRTVTWHVGIAFHQKAASLGDSQFTFQSLDAPIALRLNFRSDRTLRFHVLAGGFVGYRFAASLSGPSGSTPLQLTRYGDAGVLVGGGVDRGNITVGVRVFHALTSSSIIVDELTTYSTAVVFLFGYRIR